MTWLLLYAFLLSLYDLRTRRIPNWATLPLILAGLAAHFPNHPEIWLGSLGLFLAWSVGWMGAGDAKLWIALLWALPLEMSAQALPLMFLDVPRFLCHRAPSNRLEAHQEATYHQPARSRRGGDKMLCRGSSRRFTASAVRVGWLVPGGRVPSNSRKFRSRPLPLPLPAISGTSSGERPRIARRLAGGSGVRAPG